jgi:hypothetical protein
MKEFLTIFLVLFLICFSYVYVCNPRLLSGLQPVKASQVIRLDQTSPTQYSDTIEYNTWSDSSCSAAAMAEVLDAYGHSYSVHDVLSAEIQLGQISADQGLLYGFPSIEKTVQSFDFQASQLSNPSFDSIESAGEPVIISMRNADWPSGHILVATGGDSHSIKVVDSWSTDKTSFDRADFTAYWTGLAATVSPSTDYRSLARTDATDNNLNPDLFERQINQESGFNPSAVSPAGAIGISQIMPATAQSWNVDPHDPVASLSAAASHMAWYQSHYGSFEKALAAYNGGSSKLDWCITNYTDWLSCMPAETQRYVAAVMGD